MKFIVISFFLFACLTVYGQEESCNCLKYKIVEVASNAEVKTGEAKAVMRHRSADDVLAIGFEKTPFFKQLMYFPYSLEKSIDYFNADGVLSVLYVVPEVELSGNQQRVGINWIHDDTGRCTGDVIVHFTSLEGVPCRLTGDFDIILEREE